MSISLVKKSLQLVESSKFQGNRKVKSDSGNLNKKPALKSVQTKINKSTSKNANIIRTFQKLQKQLREKKNCDKTVENLEKIKALSGNCNLDDTKAFEFFKRATKSEKVKVEKVEEVDTSIFSEEDFARFEREYVYE